MSTSKVGGNDTSSPAELIIAIDFGTTFSGFAFALSSSLPLDIRDNCKWPGDAKAGAPPYCKNRTSLFYIPHPSEPGKLKLQDWGWSAFNAYDKALSKYMKSTSTRSLNDSDSSTSHFQQLTLAERDPLNRGGEISNVGFFAHMFKLYLAPEGADDKPMTPLPMDLTPEMLIVDYLRCLTQFIMECIKVDIPKEITMRDVQWCLTVPAVWGDDAKQQMKIYAEKAGMVKGPHNPSSSSASSRSLQIILEPEAASAYCLQQTNQSLKVIPGDRILVADVGGGTIDLVVHEVIEVHPVRGATKVKEVVASYGQLGGGTFVDSLFFHSLHEKIGCFQEYCRDVNPTLAVQLYSWWQRIKTEFTGPGFSDDYSLVSSGLSAAWRKYDTDRGVVRDEMHYEQLLLTDKDFMRIMDPEVNKVLDLIEKQITGVKLLMVVGGFAGSPYLRKRVLDKFRNAVDEIIIPMDPGRAICRGAVELNVNSNFINSRISKKTYGIKVFREAEEDDRSDLIVISDEGKRRCKNVFSVFLRAGDEVEVGTKKGETYFPYSHNQKKIEFELYTSPQSYPKYTDEEDCRYEGKFVVDISERMELHKHRQVEVTMVFGKSMIDVSAVRQNFGSSKEENGLTVTFEHSGTAL